MPQLDIIYIFTIYLWTWLMLYLIMKKTKTLLIVKVPKNPPCVKNQMLTLALPWT